MRTRIKAGYPVFVRRFKKLGFVIDAIMPEELEWELKVLDVLEQDTYTQLEALGVPSDQWQYYMGFQKRLWERYVHFQQDTFQIEKQSLITEYTLRGLNPPVLAALQSIAESCANYKRLGYWPPAFAYFNVTGVLLVEAGGYFKNVGVNISEVGGGGYFTV